MKQKKPKYKYTFKKPVRHKKLKRFLTVLAILVLMLAAAFIVYTCFYYEADQRALDATIFHHPDITVTRHEDHVTFEPTQVNAGLIIYPGAKIEYKAYALLAKKLAEKNILVELMKMPFNIALFDTDAADKVIPEHPDLDWYIAGHSLGGLAAGMHADKHPDEFKGIIFMASYPITDLSDNESLKGLSLLGSEDLFLSAERYAKAKEQFPVGTEEVVIEGGCHAGFGNYGAQKNDGEPSITSDEQQEITIAQIRKFIFPKEVEKEEKAKAEKAAKKKANKAKKSKKAKKTKKAVKE